MVVFVVDDGDEGLAVVGMLPVIPDRSGMACRAYTCIVITSKYLNEVAKLTFAIVHFILNGEEPI